MDLISGRVLVVDDEAQVRNVITQFLTRSGYEVQAAESGMTALALLDTAQRFDLVLTDIRMPVMDGTQLAERIREEHPALPIVFSSGYSEDWAEASPEDQQLPLLTKPFALSELARIVRENIRK